MPSCCLQCAFGLIHYRQSHGERERSSDNVESVFKPSKLAACMIHSHMKTCWPAVGNMSCLWLHGSWELIVCCFRSFFGGMTWLVATIFDSTQFKVCMCKLGTQKSEMVKSPACPTATWTVKDFCATGRGKFTMATEHSRFALPHSICCPASTDLWSTSMKETFLLMW